MEASDKPPALLLLEGAGHNFKTMKVTAQLHEVLAVEKSRRKESDGVFAETKTVFDKKPNLFHGRHSAYAPLSEAELPPPDEITEIVTTVPDKLAYCLGVIGRSLDVSATKDATNQTAVADVVIDGVVILEGVPAVTLLTLESQLGRWVELFRSVPTLAPGRSWVPDADRGQGIFRDSHPHVKTRTKKIVAHKILVEATQFHPAQVEKWSEDAVVGSITETQWSGMISPAAKSDLITRTQDILAAVKQARQRANCAPVRQVEVSSPIIDYVLQGSIAPN